MDVFLQILMFIVSLAGAFLLGKFLPSYLTEKGKNRARLEDSPGIVQLEELAKIPSILKADTKKRSEETKVKSYVDFINSVSSVAIAQRHNNADKEIDALASLADAKARIAIYGSTEVANKAGEFFFKYGHTCTEESLTAFIAIILAMRKEASGETEVDMKQTIAHLCFSSGQE